MPETLELPRVETPAELPDNHVGEFPAVSAPHSASEYETFVPPTARDATLTKIEAIKTATAEVEGKKVEELDEKDVKVSVGPEGNLQNLPKDHVPYHQGVRETSQAPRIPGPPTEYQLQPVTSEQLPSAPSQYAGESAITHVIPNQPH